MKKTRNKIFCILLILCALCLALAFTACGKDDDNAKYGAGEEGFYYCDGADSTRYMLSLQSGKYMITAGGETRCSGSYSYNNETGEISFSGETAFSATVRESALSLDMEGSGYSFKAYKYFDVTYVDESGKVVATESVLNGQSAENLDIEKDGYWFVGWYEDSSNSTEFAFDTSIAGNTTVYGWYIEKNLTATEYEITLDYGDGTIETEGTMNGTVWTLPSVYEGKEILGWWVSATNKSGELTYKYETGTAFTADTTLFAVYSGIGASVTGVGITWENATGSNVTIAVYNEAGNQILYAAPSSTSGRYSYDFTALSAGTYTVEVTSGSFSETLTYVANGLDRVSKSSMDVIVNGDGRVISFAPVEGATGYEITISDGAKTVTENLGSRTYYNFSGWEMTKEGLTFTVTACADGYVSSVSDAYSYILILDDVKVDIVDDVVTWNRVDGALEYEVVIYGKDNVVLDSFYTTDTSYSLKYYGAGTYTITVQPQTDGYYSEARTYDGYAKDTIAAPVVTDVTDYTVSWSKVTGAESYVVMINGETYTAGGRETTLIFSDVPKNLGTYEISVKAVAADGNDSPYGDAIIATENEFKSAVTYEQNTLCWSYDIAASYYTISVNGETFTAEGGNSQKITLNKAGDNEIVVTAYDAKGVSLGQATVTVYAYSVILDPNGAALDNDAAISGVIYVAQGDTLNLGETYMEHADFVGWYTQADYTMGQSDEYEGKGSEVEDGSVFTGNRDMYLYAYWTYEYVEVTLVAGDGTFEDGTADEAAVKIKYGTTSAELPSMLAAAEEDNFIGWFTGTDANSAQYADETGRWNGDAFAGENTLYARYLTVFTYQQTRYGGEIVYAVSAGEEINRISVVTVPESYEGRGIVLNSGAFSDCLTLITIKIPDTVRYISMTGDGYRTGTGAFEGCTYLESVVVYATEDATEPVYFSSDGVLFKKVGDASDDAEIMFYPYGKTDKKYEMPSSVFDENELSADGKVISHAVTTIPSQVFRERKAEEVVIPSSVTTIESQAFYSSVNLKKVTFEAGGKSSLVIEDGAFLDCTSLTEVTLPARCIGFDGSAFEGCLSLMNVYIEEGGSYTSVDGLLLDSLGTTLVFYPTGRGGEVIISELAGGKVQKIGESAFASNKNITSVVISENVTEIGKSAFESCTRMSSLVFEGNDNSADLAIRSYAFYGCIFLTEVYLPSNLTVMESNAFGGCSSLLYVYYDARPGARTRDLSFASGSFGPSSSVVTLTLGVNVPEIDIAGIFGGGSLSMVIIEEVTEADGTVLKNANYYSDEYGVVYSADKTKILYYPLGRIGPYKVLDETVTITSDIFSGRTGLTSVEIGPNVSSIGSYAFDGCTYLEEIIVDGENKYYGSDDNGILYSKNTVTGNLLELVYCPLAVKYTDIVVPESVLSTTRYAFYDNQVVRSVTFEATIYFSLGAYTFYGCENLEKVVLPDCMTSIPDYAFYNCYSLSSINIPTNTKSIGTYTFYRCYLLTGDLNDPENGIKLPEGLETIGGRAFWYNYTLAVTIPSTVSEIGAYAFEDCWHDESAAVAIVFAESEDPNGEVELTIGSGAFQNARYATEVVIPARTVSMGTYAFEYFGCWSETPTTIVLESENITTFSRGTFHYCSTIESFVVPASVTTIGIEVFFDCLSLTDITFAESSALTSVGEGAFRNVPAVKIELPETVTTIDLRAFDGSGLTEAEIPASVTSLGYMAFANCEDLEKVVFAEDAAGAVNLDIGYSCFAGCVSLTDVSLPERLTKTGDEKNSGGLFDGCVSLVEISIPAGVTVIVAETFANCVSLETVNFGTNTEGLCSLEKIGDRAFYGCVSLTSFEFPVSAVQLSLGAEIFGGCEIAVTLSESVTSLGGAFVGATVTQITVAEGNTSYTAGDGGQVLYSDDEKTVAFVCCEITSEDIVVPNTVETIGPSAFNGQTNIKTVTIPSGVTKIDEYAFYGCTSLETVTIAEGGGAVTFGAHAFDGCTSLKSVSLPAGLEEIPDYCFYLCPLEDLTIPGSVTRIGDYAFAGYEERDSDEVEIEGTNVPGAAITEIKLDGITYIGDYAFFNCESLVTIELGEDLTYLGAYAFAGCSSLEDIEWNCALTSLTDYVFSWCTSLKYVEIPVSVTTLKGYVFNGCSSLEAAVLPESLGSLGEGVFCGCTSLSSCELPRNISSLGRYAFYRCESLTEVILPYELKSIERECFRYCTGLKNIEFNDKLTDMSSQAFADCTGLTTLYIGPSVYDLGDRTFMNCTGLVYVYTGDSLPTIIPDMFYGCTSLETVEFGPGMKYIYLYGFYNCSSLKNIELREGIVTIDSKAFYGCTSLESLFIPSSVTNVAADAFEGCGFDIYVNNTVNFVSANWTEGWDTVITGTVYYFSQSEPALNSEGTGYDNNYWYYDENGDVAVWEFVSDGGGTEPV